MELNQSKNSADLPANRFADIQRATEVRNNELRTTVERVVEARTEQREKTDEIDDRRSATGPKGDSITLSGAARAFGSDQPMGEADEARAERLEQLKAAAEDGTLFNRDRLARAAERLLAGE